jgi:hypothetical protein
MRCRPSNDPGSVGCQSRRRRGQSVLVQMWPVSPVADVARRVSLMEVDDACTRCGIQVQVEPHPAAVADDA